MRINTRFGNLDENGVLVYAPATFKQHGIFIVNPTDEFYFKHGYKEIMIDIPADREGFHVEENGWAESEKYLVKQFKYVEDVESEPQPERIRVFSKLYLKIALMKLGIWDQVLEWMEGFDIDVGDGVSINCLEAFNTAITLSDKFDGFSKIIQMAKTQFGLDDEQINAILDACETEG